MTREDALEAWSTRQVTEAEAAWFACADLFSQAVNRAPVRDGQNIREEFVFCLIGGFGISYEHCKSVSARLNALNVLDSDAEDDVLEERLRQELSRCQFEPRRLNGQLRRYRFPYRKANLLVRARRWLAEQGDLAAKLTALESERGRREVLCGCPGIGPKTASWLLRNLGMGVNLAILDVHVMRALRATGRIGDAHLPRDYDLIEDSFLVWCRELNASPAAFDLFLWEWQRGSLLKSR